MKIVELSWSESSIDYQLMALPSRFSPMTALDVFCFHSRDFLGYFSVRSIVALNLPSYGSGRNPWGNLKPEYLEKVWTYLFLFKMRDAFTHFRLVSR